MSFRSSRGVLTAALSLAALAASPAVASAEVESPVQGKSSNGLFLRAEVRRAGREARDRAGAGRNQAG
jgi:hypothetical protein